MWMEAILEADDLARVLGELCPLAINVGKGGHVVLSDPRDIELVPGVGLRVSATLEIHWPVLGLQLPVSVRAATVDVRPEIVSTPDGDRLTFKLHVDDVDIAHLPALFDHGIVDKVNKELDAKHVELSWGFTKTLSHVFEFPDALASAAAIELCAVSGRVQVTSKALALAVRFEARIEPRTLQPAPSVMHSSGSLQRPA
jgi:hypothetical protein